jgi:hypothetical protein
MTDSSTAILRWHRGLLRVGQINRPILLVTPLSAVAEKRYSSPVGISLFRRRGPASGSDLGGSTPGQDPYEPRFFLSHFLPRRTSWKATGLETATRSSCGDARFVNAIGSLATDAAASRPTMSVTTGLGSDAAFALVAGRPSLCFPCSLFPTPTTACWPELRRSGDTLWSTARGKRRRLR